MRTGDSAVGLRPQEAVNDVGREAAPGQESRLRGPVFTVQGLPIELPLEHTRRHRSPFLIREGQGRFEISFGHTPSTKFLPDFYWAVAPLNTAVHEALGETTIALQVVLSEIVEHPVYENRGMAFTPELLGEFAPTMLSLRQTAHRRIESRPVGGLQRFAAVLFTDESASLIRPGFRRAW